MEIIIEPETLRRELGVFQSLIVKDAALLELSNLVLTATAEGKLVIFGTDGDVSLKCQTPEGSVESITAGAVCLKADKLINILGSIEPKVKSIRLKREENDYTSVLFGRSHFTIAGISVEAYPRISFLPSDGAKESLTIKAGLLRSLIESTTFAVASDVNKPALCGVNLQTADGVLKSAGTDGFRIAFTESKGSEAEVFSKIIPRKAASVLLRLLNDVPGDSGLIITADFNQVYVALGEKHFAFRQITSKYPDYELAIPKENEFKARFNLGDLKGAIKRADLFAEKNAFSPVTLTLREGEVEITARSFELGSGREIMEAEFNGTEEKKVKLKTSYLIDFFNSLNGVGSEAVVEMSFGETSATVWSIANAQHLEFDYKCVITRLG